MIDVNDVSFGAIGDWIGHQLNDLMGHFGLSDAGGLTMTVVKAPTQTGDCGGAESIVRWSVPAKARGWIVQHVTIKYDVKNCDDTPTLVGTDEYWEAWQVAGGTVYAGFMNAAGTNLSGGDKFKIADRPGSWGRITITGYALFWKDYNLQSPPWALPGQAGHNIHVIHSNEPSLDPPGPVGWSDQRGLGHTLKSSWYCCGRQPRKPDVCGAPGK
jgi:hypothetical protein